MSNFTKEFKVRGGTNIDAVYQPCRVVYSGTKYTVLVNANGREFSRKTATLDIRDIDKRTDEEKATNDILKLVSRLPSWRNKSEAVVEAVKAGSIHGLKWSVE